MKLAEKYQLLFDYFLVMGKLDESRIKISQEEHYKKILENISPSEVNAFLYRVFHDAFQFACGDSYVPNSEALKEKHRIFLGIAKKLINDLVKKEEENTHKKAKFFTRLSYILIVSYFFRDSIYNYFHAFFTRRQSLQRLHTVPKNSGSETQSANEYGYGIEEGQRNRKGVVYRVEHMTDQDQIGNQWYKRLFFNKRGEFRKFLDQDDNGPCYTGTREQIERVRYRIADTRLDYYLTINKDHPEAAYACYSQAKSLLFATGREAERAISSKDWRAHTSNLFFVEKINETREELRAARTASVDASDRQQNALKLTLDSQVVLR